MRIQPSQRLFIGIVFVSLAAHGLVLKMPWRDRSTIENEPSTEEDVSAEWIEQSAQAIAITALPAQSSSPKPQIRPQIKSPPAAQSQTIPQPPQQPSQQLAPQAIQTQVQPQPKPAAVAQLAPEPIAQPIAQPIEEPIEKPIEEPPPNTQPTRPVTPDLEQQPSAKPEPTEPEHGIVVQLGDRFPHFQNSQSGCYDLANCHRITGEGSYRQAAKKLIANMRTQGFQVSAQDDIDEQGHRVFVVVSPDEPDETYYLNVFSDSSGSTVYAVTLEIVSLTQLQQLNNQASL